MSEYIVPTEGTREESVTWPTWPDASFSIGPPAITYTFSEDKYLEELKEYIDKTYTQHYANGKIQTTQYILDQCDTPDFLRGNVLKYASRYGKKEGYQRKDLLKLVHYSILMLHYHDTKRINNDK